MTEDDFKAPKKEYSPYVGDYFPNRVYFGDTHLHTSWSTDAGMIGATLGPDEAYRVSRGETVTSFSGFKIKLIRPLDFIVGADHAENLGLADFIRRSDPIILANETGKRWRDLSKAGEGYQAFIEWAQSDKKDLINEPRMAESVWKKVVANADKYYQPGVFTTFTGFEWSSMPDGNNMHRVVMFRDGARRTNQVLPYTMYDLVDVEGLWDYMAVYWTDPDFDPEQRAFYYVRVIEIPTPRWTAYDARFFNIKMPKDTRMTVQDRAYTSPIWYTP